MVFIQVGEMEEGKDVGAPMGPPTQATRPPWSGAGVGVGMLRGWSPKKKPQTLHLWRLGFLDAHPWRRQYFQKVLMNFGAWVLKAV